MDTVQVRILIEGKLQGMNFRYKTQDRAKELELVGFVRTLSDGRIEIEVQGEESKVDKLLDWCQEEPQNQGAWYCSQHHFRAVIPKGTYLTYAGRKASAAPAVGYMSVHVKEQTALVTDALTVE